MQKTIFITGGNKGIGLETTRLFLANHDKVIIAARDFEHFEFKEHPLIKMIPFDLTQTEKLSLLIDQVGEIDILINNAGLMNSLPYNNYPDEKFQDIMNLNLYTPIALITAFSEQMKQKHEGRIVNTASIAGQIGHPDIWYGITKAGIINATKSFAKLLGPQGIIINAVAPGPVETDMMAVIPDARKKQIKDSVFLDRFATAQEVAKTIYWLATSSPEYINGTCIDINNGAFPR